MRPSEQLKALLDKYNQDKKAIIDACPHSVISKEHTSMADYRITCEECGGTTYTKHRPVIDCLKELR